MVGEGRFQDGDSNMEVLQLKPKLQCTIANPQRFDSHFRGYRPIVLQESLNQPELSRRNQFVSFRFNVSNCNISPPPQDQSSTFRPCFRMVDHKPFMQMCINDLAKRDTRLLSDKDVCDVAAFYVEECGRHGVPLRQPKTCGKRKP